MSDTTAIIPTKNASRYLQQLCKHFARKVDVEFTQDEGTVSLPFGTCRLSADSERLVLRGTSEDSNLPRLESLLGDHLARFAFRENPTIDWQRTA